MGRSLRSPRPDLTGVVSFYREDTMHYLDLIGGCFFMILASALALFVWKFLLMAVFHPSTALGVRALYGESAESFWMAGVLSIIVGVVLYKLAVAPIR